MEDFDTMTGFLEHISLVMDVDRNANEDAVSIMTLHSAKGLEFDIVFLPGWEDGLFPSQRTMDENGRAGLEEERRLAYVGLTRARRRAFVWFAANRRTHGLWQSAVPSRFLEELPEANIEIVEDAANYGGYGGNSYGTSRFDTRDPFANTYETPGWQRAQKNRGRNDEFSRRNRAGPTTIDGELVAKSVTGHESEFTARRARLPPEIRLRPHHLDRGQQAHHRFREGRHEARHRQLRREALTSSLSSSATIAVPSEADANRLAEAITAREVLATLPVAASETKPGHELPACS